MTDNVETDVSLENKDIIPRSGVTAFLLVKLDSGAWKAITDLTVPLAVDRAAVVTDIKQACGEIRDAIQVQELAWAVSERLKQNEGEDSQRTAASMRDALDRRQS